MKILLTIIFMLLMFISGGATIYFGDAWYFEKHTGVVLSEFYNAEKECRAENNEKCFLTGGFLPGSYFNPRKFPVDKGI